MTKVMSSRHQIAFRANMTAGSGKRISFLTCGNWSKDDFSQAPPEGSPTGGLCPQGGYCPQGAKTPEPCPVGKYSGTKGNKEPDDCITCDPGYVLEGTPFCFRIYWSRLHVQSCREKWREKRAGAGERGQRPPLQFVLVLFSFFLFYFRDVRTNLEPGTG